MPIDWDSVQGTIETEAKAAADETSEQLATQISSLTRMTDQEIKELFPTPADVEKLTELMRIVKSAEQDNIKINRLASNIQGLAGTAITLLNKFV